MCNVNSMISFETLVIHFHRVTLVVSVRTVSFLYNFFLFVLLCLLAFLCSFCVFFFPFHLLELAVLQCSVIFVCEAIHHLKINEQNFDSSTLNWEMGKKSYYSRIVNNSNSNNKNKKKWKKWQKWQKLKWITTLTWQRNIHWYLTWCENGRHTKKMQLVSMK